MYKSMGRDMLKRMPACAPTGVVDFLEQRCSVLPVPLETDCYQDSTAMGAIIARASATGQPIQEQAQSGTITLTKVNTSTTGKIEGSFRGELGNRE